MELVVSLNELALRFNNFCEVLRITTVEFVNWLPKVEFA
jgi:hypothetical protein